MTTQDLCQSFKYVARKDARILILGSMPGIKSLQKQEYYAHPQNSFWLVMHNLFKINPLSPYKERLQAIKNKQVALWDVAAICLRPGSLDSNIKNVTPNDFKSLFKKCPHIHSIFFNGKKSEALFKKLVSSKNHALNENYEMLALPSTSPAHAALTTEQKIKIWKRALLKKS